MPVADAATLLSPRQLVYYYFRKWKRDNTILLLHDKLVEWVRVKKGKKEEPSAAIMDSQSVKTTLTSHLPCR